ncbi:MAG: ribose-phosphate diphosphokinase, partial [Armatimonadetes bacterium]|nr:ribose-phosphate diphosphokinase [Armatimonadota bacterium]
MPVDHLYGGPILGRHLLEQGFADQDVVVVSPDVAGVSRAKRLGEMLHKPFVVIAKRRPAPNEVEVVEIVGDFKGKKCIIIDDMIDTGGSVASGARELLNRGATEVIATCTHPVFSNNAVQRLVGAGISQVISLDTIPIPEEQRLKELTVLPSAPLIGEAMRRIHLNESVSELFHDWN